MNSNILLLYSNCIPLKGASRSSIIDLQLGQIHFMPNGIFDLMEEQRFFQIDAVLSRLDAKSSVVFKEYVTFLIERDLAFYCQHGDIASYPPLTLEWEFPALITNCIIDSNGVVDYFSLKFLSQLSEVCCNHLQFRFYNVISLDYLAELIELINDSQIKTVEFVLPYQEDKSFMERAKSFIVEHKKIETIIIHSARQEEIFYGDQNHGRILTTKSVITDASHCGTINPLFFAVNISHFSESLSHNTCLNRKISIDVSGNIKNCPSMQQTFGLVNEVRLWEVAQNKDFQKHWNIAKEQISSCQHCEFRHVCTDCRAYIEDPSDNYSKPLKCGYDPFTCEWGEWSQQAVKQPAISQYQLKDFLKASNV